ncbi:hypothetical protein Pcinc_011123 [Petrolisthes cinctipes]|uniref:Uncharacterized protein n=1 Tax=Petrolisthes cinctipes TaxID=88211 RepID=A0AAE1KSW8_PETCI|nr:hypothetical protein Pcinc_011123 [Petrolisthes cinctipes]
MMGAGGTRHSDRWRLLLVVSLTTTLVTGLPATLDIPQHDASIPNPSLLLPSDLPKQQQETHSDPRVSFNYRYQVKATDTGDEKSHQETLENGVLVGSYSVVQPDGTLRTVTYRADDVSGFQAKVQFQENYADPIAFSPVSQSATPSTSSTHSSSTSGAGTLASTVASGFAPSKFSSTSTKRDFSSTSSRFTPGSAASQFDSSSAQKQSSSTSSRFTSGSTRPQFGSTFAHSSSLSGPASRFGATSSQQASSPVLANIGSTSKKSSLLPSSRFTSTNKASTRFTSSAASKIDVASSVDELASTPTRSKLSTGGRFGTSSRTDSGFSTKSSSASRSSSSLTGSKFGSSTLSTTTDAKMNPAAAAHFGLQHSTRPKFRTAGSRRGASLTPASTFVLSTGAFDSPSSGTLASQTRSSTGTLSSRLSGGTSGQTQSSFSSSHSGVRSSDGISRLQQVGSSIGSGTPEDHSRTTGTTTLSRVGSGALDRTSITSSHSRFTAETSASHKPGSVSPGSTSLSRFSSGRRTPQTDSQVTKLSTDHLRGTFSSSGSRDPSGRGDTATTSSSKFAIGTAGHIQSGLTDSRTISGTLDQSHSSVSQDSQTRRTGGISSSKLHSSSRFVGGGSSSQTGGSITRLSAGSSTLTGGTSVISGSSVGQAPRRFIGKDSTTSQFKFTGGTSTGTQTEHSSTPFTTQFHGFTDEETSRLINRKFKQAQSSVGSVSTGTSTVTGQTFEAQALDSFNRFSDKLIQGSTRAEASRKTSETSDFPTRGSTLASQFSSEGTKQDQSSFSTSLTDSHTKFGSRPNTFSGHSFGSGSTFAVGSQTRGSSQSSSAAGQETTRSALSGSSDSFTSDSHAAILGSRGQSDQSVLLDSTRQSDSISLSTGARQNSDSSSSATSQIQRDGNKFFSQRLSSGLSGVRGGASRTSNSRPTFNVRSNQQSSNVHSAARQSKLRASHSGDQRITASRFGTQQAITSPSSSQRTRISQSGNQQVRAPFSGKQETRTSLSTNQQIRTFNSQQSTSDSNFQQQSTQVGSSSFNTQQQQSNPLLQLSGGEPLSEDIINGSLFITNQNLDGIDAIELARNGITGQSFAYRLVSIPIRP